MCSKHSSNGQHFAPTCSSPVSNLIYFKEQNTQINPSIIKASRESPLIPSRQYCKKLRSMEFSLLHALPPSVLTAKESIPETEPLYFLLHHAVGVSTALFFCSFLNLLTILLPLYTFSLVTRPWWRVWQAFPIWPHIVTWQCNAGTIRISPHLRLNGFPSSLLTWFQVYSHLNENQKNHHLFTRNLSAFTSLRGKMAVTEPLVQDLISNSKWTRGKHCLFTHQLLMMNFISWVMPEFRIHLHFRNLFCFNIGQPRTCIAPQW